MPKGSDVVRKDVYILKITLKISQVNLALVMSGTASDLRFFQKLNFRERGINVSRTKVNIINYFTNYN